MCYNAFDVVPSPFASAEPMIGVALNAVDNCYNGVSLINVINGTGLVNVTAFDLKGLVGAQINNLDFASISNFNLT